MKVIMMIDGTVMSSSKLIGFRVNLKIGKQPLSRRAVRRRRGRIRIITSGSRENTMVCERSSGDSLFKSWKEEGSFLFKPWFEDEAVCTALSAISTCITDFCSRSAATVLQVS